MHEQNGILKIPHDILAAFDYADRQCGFDRVLEQIQYPPSGKISIPGDPEGGNYKRQDECFPKNPDTPTLINKSVNTLCYGGCATWSTAYDYLRHKKPWWVEHEIWNRIDFCWLFVASVSITLNTPAALFHPRQDLWHISTIPPFKRPYMHQRRNLSRATTLYLPPYHKKVLYLQPIRSCLPFWNRTSAFISTPRIMISCSITLGLSLWFRIWLGEWCAVETNEMTFSINLNWISRLNKQGFHSPPNRKFLVNGKVAGNWGEEVSSLLFFHVFSIHS